VLATPIESILGLPVDPPPGTRRNAKAARHPRPLLAPLSVGGLSPPVARAFRAVAAHHHRSLTTAPFAPVTSAFPPHHPRPASTRPTPTPASTRCSTPRCPTRPPWESRRAARPSPSPPRWRCRRRRSRSSTARRRG